jgi:hypothetical protein
VIATKLLLVTGETIEVTGGLDDVAKQVEDASRSSAGALAWFEQSAGGRVGVNPSHVVAIRPQHE